MDRALQKTIPSISVKKGGHIIVNSGSGRFCRTMLTSGAIMEVASGGVARNITNSGGTANVLGGGTLHVSSGFTAKGISTYETALGASGGGIIVSSGGSLTSSLADSNGGIYLSGGYALSTTVASGQMLVYNGGMANGGELSAGSIVLLQSGASAKAQVVSGGQFVISAGSASDVRLLYSGSCTVYNGGFASHVALRGATYQIPSMTLSGGTVADCSSLQSASVTVLSGATLTDVNTSNYGSVFISSGGFVSNIQAIVRGKVYVSSGGTAVNLTKADTNSYTSALVDGGELTIQGDFSASRVDVSNGIVTVQDSGSINSFSLSGETTVNVNSAGHVSNITVPSSCSMLLSGGNAVNCTASGTSSLIQQLASVPPQGVPVFQSCSAANLGELHVRTSAVDCEVSDSGILYVLQGATAQNCSARTSGFINIFSGGTVTGAVVESQGSLHIQSGGIGSNLSAISSGRVYVSSGGTAVNLTQDGAYYNLCAVVNGGTLVVQSNFVASGIELLNASADIYAMMDQFHCSNTTINVISGDLTNGLTDANCTINMSSGIAQFCYIAGPSSIIQQAVSYQSGGLAYCGILSSASAYVQNLASQCQAYDSGIIFIQSGGTAQNCSANTSGLIFISQGGFGTQCSATSSGRIIVMGQLSGGSIFGNYTVESRPYMRCSAGGIITDGYADGGAVVQVMSGGSLLNTVIQGGDTNFVTQIQVYTFGFASNITVKSGALLRDYAVTSAPTGAGIVMSNIQISSGGSVLVSYGMTAGDTVARGFTVSSGGRLQAISSGAYIRDVTVSSGGLVRVCSGARLLNQVKQDSQTSPRNYFYGSVWVSGGTAQNLHTPSAPQGITIHGGGTATMYSGCVASNVVVNNTSSILYAASTGKAVSARISSGGTFVIQPQGVGVNTLVYNAGQLAIRSGGTSISAFVLAGGVHPVQSKGLTSRPMVSSGGTLRVSSGGTATYPVVRSGGTIWIQSGATITSLTSDTGAVVIRQ